MTKKLLTFLTLLTLFFGVGWAAETVYKTLDISTATMSSYVNSYTSNFTATNNGTSWTIRNFNNGQATSNWTSIRAGRSGNTSVASITPAPETGNISPIDVAITKVVVDVEQVNNNVINTTKLYVSSDGNFGDDSQIIELSSLIVGENTYEIPTPLENQHYKLEYDLKSGGSNGSLRIKKVEYYYDDGTTQTPTCTQPTISGTTPFVGSTTVTISCNDPADANIYYTTTGADPDDTSTPYTAPFTLTEGATVKAIAYKTDYNPSPIASKEFVKATSAETVAEIVALDNNTEFTFTGSLTVSGQATTNGNKYLYAQDDTGGMLFFNANQDYSMGDVIPVNFTGKKTTYNGAPEVTNINMAAATTHGQTLSVDEITPNNITVDPHNVFEYSVIKNATITLSNNKYYINVGDESVQIYDRFGHEVPSDYADNEYDIYGVSGWYNGAQFMPLEYVKKVIVKYAVTCADATNGEISTDKEEYAEGETVTVTVNPDPGYELATLVYNDGSDHNITATEGVYSFEIPAHAVTITATFSKINYNIARIVKTNGNVSDTGGWLGCWDETTCTLPNGDQGNYIVTSNYGNVVKFKAGTKNNYQILPQNVVVTYVDSNNETQTIVPTPGLTDNLNQNGEYDAGCYGTWFTFTMPANDVTVTANFTPYAPDVYFLVGDNWDNGTKMAYNSTDKTYSLRIYFADEQYGYFRFKADGGSNGTKSYASGATGDWWGLTGTTEGESAPLYQNSEKRFRIPAGIYDIEVGQVYDDPTTSSNPNWWGQTSIIVTKVEPTLTFDPAAGEVANNQTVYVSSDLYELLSAIDSNVQESAVSNQVKIGDGAYGDNVAITEAATVTGRAKYLNIEQTATADYTIKPENTNNQYQLVKDITKMASGEKYLLVSTGSYKTSGVTYNFEVAATSVGSNNLLGGADVNIEDDIITLQGETEVIPYIMTLSEGKWTFKNSETDEYLTFAPPSSGTGAGIVGTSATTGTGLTLTSIDETTGVAVLTLVEGRTLQFNPNNAAGDPSKYRFTTFVSSQKPVMLFKQVKEVVTLQVETPEFNPAGGTYTSAQNVEISCATNEATIWYKTSEMTEYAEYTSAIPVSANTTITAYATKTGYTDSETATATYKFKAATAEEFVLVTSTDQLVAGNDYIIVISDEFDKAFGTIDNASADAGYETGFTCTADRAVVTLSEGSNVNILTLGNTNHAGYYTFKQKKNGKYIYAMPTGSQIKDDNVNSDYTNEFTISINAGNNNATKYATIQGGGGQQILYRTNAGVFRHYASSNATNSSYRRVMLYTRIVETPEPESKTLAEIESSGVVGNDYTISDQLIAVHYVAPQNDNYAYLWCKDQDNASICPTGVKEVDGVMQIDYMKDVLHAQTGNWDQSNWVVLKFAPAGQANITSVENAKGHYINSGAITGTYTDGANYTITMPEGEGLVGKVGDAVTYTPNVYCPANYVDANLNLTEQSTGAGPSPSGKYYFFMNPKIQEVAEISIAVWNGTGFRVPANNSAGLEGSVNVNWTFNGADVSSDLTEGKTYHFLAVLAPSAKAAEKTVYPLNLEGGNANVITAVADVNSSKTVAGVKYYNLAGMASDKPFDGVNIIVTTYTDGSRSSAKVLR